jgi:hypothetical protein
VHGGFESAKSLSLNRLELRHDPIMGQARAMDAELCAAGWQINPHTAIEMVVPRSGPGK